MPLRVGITGGIGSGKSTAAKIFEVLGIPVYYADEEAKRIMNNNPVVRDLLIKEFGEPTYDNDVLNRQHLASIVFTDKARLEKLNHLVHPITLQDSDEWMSRQEAAYSLKEAALIFESGAARNLDYVIGVSAPLALRIQRVMKRDNIKREDVLLRMERQIDESLKMKLCNFVLINDEQQMLLPQVLQLHQRLKELSNSKKNET